MSEVKELMASMVPFMAAIMTRQMEIATLREILGREATPGELMYFENQLWRRNLNQWWQDRQNGYRKIHDFVWG